jgi:hypothetical protein
MSQEKKDAQRDKEKLSKNAKRHLETPEENTQRRDNDRDRKTRKRLFETPEDSAKRKKTDCDRKTKQRQSETVEQNAKRNKTDRDRKTKQRQTETVEQGAKRNKTKRDCMRKKREEMRHQLQSDRRDCNGQDMAIVIDCATKEAKQYLHRTQDPANPHMHRATVCIICDRFIIGTETIHKLTKENIGKHCRRLGVKSYEEYYQTILKEEVKKQYRVQGLQDMLLLP